MPSLGRRTSQLKFSDRELPPKSETQAPKKSTSVKRSEAKNRIREKYKKMQEKGGGKY
jgi:hypothetical protein